MTRHLDSEEVAQFRTWLAEKKTPMEIWDLHKKARKQRRQAPLTLTAVRKALRGVTHRGAEVETRGRKRSLSQRAVAALDKKRKELVEKCDGDREVPWAEVIKKACVKCIHHTAVEQASVDAGISVASRALCGDPQHKAEHDEERTETCRKWRFLPNDYFSEGRT